MTAPIERDFHLEAQAAAEDHLEAIAEAEESKDAGEDVESPASAPHCGCTTCDIREALYAAWPVFLEAAKAAVPCVCHEAYKTRDLEDPACQHHDLVRELEVS